MSAREIVGPFSPSAHQTIHIFVSTKIRFQATLRRIFGEQRLAAINASVNPFVLPLVYYRHSLDVFIFVYAVNLWGLTMASFPYFYGGKHEGASNFLDDLEMAFLISGRDDDEVKLRAFPLVLREEAKTWFQGLPETRKNNWDTLKETFLSRYANSSSPEKLWQKLTHLQQVTLGSYAVYETQFLKLWNEWEASLPEGERAPNFLQKERFLAGLSPVLQEKVRGKFPENFEEAMHWAKAKDRKLQFQSGLLRRELQPLTNEQPPQPPPAPPVTPEDPHLELLQRVTNQYGQPVHQSSARA